jgi:DNA-binding protein HU-beta
MTKTELIEKLRETGLSKSDASTAVDGILDAITAAMNSGEKVTLTGFGTFEVVDTPARTGRNPQTGEAVQIPAGKRIKFKPGKQLKEAVRA